MFLVLCPKTLLAPALDRAQLSAGGQASHWGTRQTQGSHTHHTLGGSRCPEKEGRVEGFPLVLSMLLPSPPTPPQNPSPTCPEQRSVSGLVEGWQSCPDAPTRSGILSALQPGSGGLGRGGGSSTSPLSQGHQLPPPSMGRPTSLKRGVQMVRCSVTYRAPHWFLQLKMIWKLY